MNNVASDDLFQDSTMTFGEHLEELRGALARALIGLLAGFLIALPFADDAVRFVSRPLEKALARVKLKITKHELKQRGTESLTPEEWSLLGDQKLIPSRIQLDVDSVVDQLANMGVVAQQPASFDYLLTRHDIPADQSSTVAQAWDAERTSLFATAGKALWNQLNEPTQNRLAEIADKEINDADAQKDVIAALNGLIADTKVTNLPAFDDLTKLFADEEQAAAINALRQAAMDGNDKAEQNRLNRLLVAKAINAPSVGPRPRVISVRVWEPIDVAIQSLSAEEPFLILIKAALILGLMISSPWVFFQIWNFVAAGLYPQEKNKVYTYLPISLGLFFAGASMAFAFVFEPVLDFLFGFNVLMNIDAAPRIKEWVGFVLFLPLGFGLSFQLPLVMLLLERTGIMSIETFSSNWRIAVLVIFVIAMFLTPADPMSMLLMALPLTILYFGGIQLCRFMPRSTSPIGAGYDP